MGTHNDHVSLKRLINFSLDFMILGHVHVWHMHAWQGSCHKTIQWYLLCAVNKMQKTIPSAPHQTSYIKVSISKI